MAGRQVMIIGEMFDPSLSVGGGPVYPPPGVPTHPIAPGGPAWWPGSPPHPIPPTVWPTPPGGGTVPPGFWGGVAPPHVDIGFPSPQPGPSHPIVLPPGTPKPPLGIWSEPILPPEIWGPNDPRPTQPIYIWGDPIKPAEKPEILDWHAGWSIRTGWVIFAVPNVPAPTPSKA